MEKPRWPSLMSGFVVASLCEQQPSLQPSTT